MLRLAMKSFLYICILSTLVSAGSLSAAISITGVADKTVYADSVTFTVSSEAGWDYTVMLNDDPAATDTATVVDFPDYYELYVHRVNQTTSEEEEQTVQFIVRDSSRGSSETGLPTFTPYPPVDSAAAEFAGAVLNIVTPANYPMGLEIPVAARVNDGTGDRVGVFGDVTATGYEDHPVKLLRGVGSAFLPAATAAGAINYNAVIHSLSAPKTINIEAATTWQTASGTISANTDWGTNARIHVNAGLTVAAGATLTVGQGSVIKIDPGLEITVNGSIAVNGTVANPVVFTAEDRDVPWGGFLFPASTSVGDFYGTIMTASGADSSWSPPSGHSLSRHRSEQPLLYLYDGADVTLTDCYLIDHHGLTGHGENSTLTMTRCLVQKFVAGGQYNYGSVTANDSALIEFPAVDAPFADDDNDGFYLTGGAHSFTNTLVGWALDDGVDAGSGDGGTVDINNCWFESSYHEAMAWSGHTRRDVTIADTVAINAGQGIESGWEQAFVTATRCLSTGNMVGARLGDNYIDWAPEGFLDVTDSLLLYNYRDVWGRAWYGDWSEHIEQMNIQNNYLSIPHPSFPVNTLWDPMNDPNQANELIPFLPTPATTVGMGLAILNNAPDMTDLKNQIPVRLSTFTTKHVSVNYTIYSNGNVYDSGTLDFVPGESVKFIEFAMPSLPGLQQFSIALSDPVNADLTGYDSVTYTVPYEVSKQLIEVGDDWLYRKGTSEPPANWNDLSFVPDGSWLVGSTPIGYETGSGLEECISTDLTDMKGSYWSVYARKTFNLDDPSRVTELILHIDFDDGYIAYINGTEVHSQFPPDPVAYNQKATTDNHEASCSGNLPEYDISAFISELAAGENVLCLQVHNTTLDSSDFIFIPALSITADPYPGDFEPNGKVDLVDLSILSAAWQSSLGDGNYNPLCDIAVPTNEAIDISDLLVLAENWLTEF